MVSEPIANVSKWYEYKKKNHKEDVANYGFIISQPMQTCVISTGMSCQCLLASDVLTLELRYNYDCTM